MTSLEGQFVNCPICDKRYPTIEIENHADKCIFLTAESENTVATKRACDYEQCTSSKKKIKNDSSMNDHQEESSSYSYNGSSMQGEVGFESIINSTVPLAEQMRPSDLQDYMGQEHVLGQKSVLRILLEKRDIPSMILWGPPGCGKTTLAHIIAKLCKGNNQGSRFVKLSATMVGVNDVKEVVKIAKNEQTAFKRRTILFMDEIHRFNKLQQDIFLPHVESGVITLIGATTENPSFSLNSALLSRCRVVVLEKIDTENMITILLRALRNVGARVVHPGETNINSRDIPRVLIDNASVHWLAEMCDGDARIALNSLQLALQSKHTGENCQVPMITLDDIKEGVKRSHLLYDKKGDEHYNIISAVHKSIRASDDNAALYWLTRMMQGGEDPIFIARRLVRAASEDIGLADPKALPLAVAAMQGCQLLGMPECDVLLAECAIYLARAPKSTEAYRALGKAKQCITDHQGPHPSVPLHLRNAPTRLMKDLGYGKGYNMAHKDVSNLIYMPEGMEKVNFFH